MSVESLVLINLFNRFIFLNDITKLRDYIDYLGNHTPNNQHWTEQDKLAYYINLYNAATIQLILRHYPVESIRDIGSKFQIPFINTPWQIKFIKLEGQLYNLDNIEHNIIRKVFNEPRIHFALVCAARSCPKLRNEAYDADQLDEQLADQTWVFLANSKKNKIEKDALILSKIFQWYRGDFTKEGDIREFIDKHTEIDVSMDLRIRYMEYDWALNELKGP